MSKRGGKQGGGGRGGRGGGRGGPSKPQSARGGKRGGGGAQYDLDFYAEDDDYLPFNDRNQQHRQRTTEEEVYQRIQQAKAGRGGGAGNGRSFEGSSGYRPNGSGGFRPPPPPKQNGNGKNSKHFFWPHPDHVSNSSNNNIYNKNMNNNNTGQSPNNFQRGKSRNAPLQVMFNRATSLSNPATMRGKDEDEGEDSDENSDDESEIDSSDDLIDRGIDSDDESDEEFLMQQFNWIEEDQDPSRGNAQVERARGAQKNRREHAQQHQEVQRPAVDDLLTACLEPLSVSTLDTAMTQSEDFMQAMEAEGEIKVHADEIEDLSRPLAALEADSLGSIAHRGSELGHLSMLEVFSSTLEMSQDATLESRAQVVTKVGSIASASDGTQGQEEHQKEEVVLEAGAVAVEKPKKKAHRSKRGKKTQRERQANKQLIVGNDDDGPMYLEELSDEDDEDEEEFLAMEDYLLNTKDSDSLIQLESLLGALKGLQSGKHGHSKNVGGMDPDDSDYEQQASEVDSEDEEDFDFEEDYEDGIKKLDFTKVSASINDKRKSRKADDLLRDELQDLMPLWRSGALQDGDGANRRFKSRAKGYDLYDSDDNFMVASSAGGKNKNKNKKEPHGGSFESLMDINRQIEDFVKDRRSDSLQLPPMPKPLRRKVHLLCSHYNLRSQSVGSGKRRFPILIKTDKTKMPLNPVNVNKLLNQSEKELTFLSAQFQGSRKGGNGGSGGGFGGGNGGKGGFGGKGKAKARGGGSAAASTAALVGTVVGGSASAISVENLGHRMLSKMGWSPGVGLGASGEGITQPIEAIVRAKNRGLGHE